MNKHSEQLDGDTNAEANLFLKALEEGRMSASEGGIPGDLLPYLQAADENELAGEPLELSVLESADDSRTSALAEYFSEHWGWEEDEEEANNNENDVETTRENNITTTQQKQIKEVFERLCEKIFARRPEHDISPTRKRVQMLLEYLADPQANFLPVHIAGTNGKTTTARIVDALVSELGLRTGRYTSPHLNSVCERISIMGQPISEAEFIALYADIAPVLQLVESKTEDDGLGKLSFFELLTVMAYQAFSDAPVDVAVVEVGMGGRWDATNVLQSPIQIITPVSYDHQQYLGESLAEIAAEKAGIINDGSDVVIGLQTTEAAGVIAAKLEEKGAHGYWLGQQFEVLNHRLAVGGQMFDLRTPAAVYQDLYLPLHGRHQVDNAACALMAVELMGGGKSLSGEVVEAALNRVESPGRAEFLIHSPAVIVDAAHNLDGARALSQTLQHSFDFKRIIGVFSCLSDKNAEALLGELEPILDAVVITEIADERALSCHELYDIAIDVFGEDRVSMQPYIGDALVEAVELAESEGDPGDSVAVVIYGSVRLAGAAKALKLRQ